MSYTCEDKKTDLILVEFEETVLNGDFRYLNIISDGKEMDTIDLSKIGKITLLRDGFTIHSKKSKDVSFVFYDTVMGLELIE